MHSVPTATLPQPNARSGTVQASGPPIRPFRVLRDALSHPSHSHPADPHLASRGRPKAATRLRGIILSAGKKRLEACEGRMDRYRLVLQDFRAVSPLPAHQCGLPEVESAAPTRERGTYQAYYRLIINSWSGHG